jgi:hypothetical protein
MYVVPHVALLLVCNHYVRHDEKPNHDKVVAHMGLLADSSNNTIIARYFNSEC